MHNSLHSPTWAGLLAIFVLAPAVQAYQGQADRFRGNDLYRFRSVGAVALSPDGRVVAYTVVNHDRPGRPSSQVWVMDLFSQKSMRLGGEKEPSSNPVWSPDGKWLAFQGGEGDKTSLFIAHPDGSEKASLVAMTGTNAPLPGQGESIAWSPDGKQIAFVSAMPGPETAEAGGDPMVITRYLYKPTASEGATHFNDNRRLHIFVVNLATRRVRQVTQGIHYEHPIDWSPDGKEILFVSDPEPNSDEFFNYDLFALNVADGSVRRLAATESCEYVPRWSPDGRSIVYLGTKRGLTDRETTMEDTHVWLMNADGSARRELG